MRTLRIARTAHSNFVVAVSVALIATAVSGARHFANAQSATSGASGQSSYSPADARFMRGMIMHHGQALEMTALIPDRTTNSAIKLIGQRIEVSQKDEIKLMRHWLEVRHEPVSDSGAMSTMAGHADMKHDMPGMSSTRMPGMLTPEQMAQLTAAKGAEFDRLFLTFMIQHHQGALTMVKDLFATPGAGQEPEAFQFASDVNTDQQAEIARMRMVLSSLPTTRRP